MHAILSRRVPLGSLLLVLTLSLAPRAAADAPKPPRGFTALFNGSNLDGWHGMPHYDPYKLAALPDDQRKALLTKWTTDARAHWKVENGELVNDGHGAYLTTDRDFGDIELLIEYKTVAKADSGIYLRATPQVQIWDTTKAGGKWDRGADKGSGGLYNNPKGSPGQLPLVHADRPFGQWNSFRIVMVGERVTVHLNGKLVVDHVRLANFWDKKKPLPRRGPIQLQTHGGEIRWRNVFLREIPPDEANDLLRRHDAQRFESIFNGSDFTGWTGTLQNYEVKDGAIVCRPRKGGNIFTKEQYADFVARLEYTVPPGGNNGLALRYPGKGHAGTQGLCEVQILDDDHKRYAKLDTRQYNGSAYGMVAAQRGYSRPAGQWNFMEVTARGTHLTVELNGTRIVDADLAKVSQFLHNEPHPGRTRPQGHFGFCGHSDPVAFRHLQIRRLNQP